MSHSTETSKREDKPRQKVIVLFTYGGGVRGLVPTYLLDYIENKTGYNISDLVDVFAGPSTGAIINAGLNVPDLSAPHKPRYKAKHLIRFYERESIKIFTPDKSRSFRGFIHDFNNRTMKIGQLKSLIRHGHYDSKNLQHAITRLIGRAPLSSTLKSLIIPTYVINGDHMSLAQEDDETAETPVRTRNNFVDDGGHALWFKNIKFQGARHVEKPPKVSLLNAILASTAAPTFFPCHHFTMKDGVTKDGHDHIKEYACVDGCIFDNPCTTYYGALRPHLPDNADVIFIALGTGFIHKSIDKDEWNNLGSLGVVDPVNDLPLINIFFNASESALLHSFDSEIGDNAYIFNKSMVPGFHQPGRPNRYIDDASPENMTNLKVFANEIINENKKRLDDLCELLVQEKQWRDTPSQSEHLSAFQKFFDFIARRQN